MFKDLAKVTLIIETADGKTRQATVFGPARDLSGKLPEIMDALMTSKSQAEAARMLRKGDTLVREVEHEHHEEQASDLISELIKEMSQKVGKPKSEPSGAEPFGPTFDILGLGGRQAPKMPEMPGMPKGLSALMAALMMADIMSAVAGQGSDENPLASMLKEAGHDCNKCANNGDCVLQDMAGGSGAGKFKH